MGIKFRCPNGHKLNVKSFLAGKRGICPHCGAKVQIPGEPEQAEEAGMAAGGVAIATAVVGAPTASLADTVTLPNTLARPSVPMGAAIVTSAPAPVSVAMVNPSPAPMAAVSVSPPMGVAAPFAAAPAPAMPTVAAPLAPSPYAVMPAAPVDPIVEAPNAVWYVRPPSGGQFGPARGDIMRKWLGEGRVSSDSLVWRDGWADWKSATAVFPSLGGAPVPAPAPSAPLLSGATVPAGASASKNAAARSIRAKKRGNSFAVGMVIGLGLLAVLLLVVFIAVLSGALGS